MTNISFSKTIPQCRTYLKTVTRRTGKRAETLKPAQVIQQIEKGQGLRLGEHVTPIHKIQVISNQAERLDTIITQPEYGRLEMIREGFPAMPPADFVDMFCEMNKCQPSKIITRIDFRYYLTEHVDLILKVPESIAVCASCKKAITISPDGWDEQDDGTWVCNSYSRWREEEPDIQEREAWKQFEESHAAENYMPYIHWMPIDNSIETWLVDTFRFEIS